MKGLMKKDIPSDPSINNNTDSGLDSQYDELLKKYKLLA
jgi:hypothetical protein